MSCDWLWALCWLWALWMLNIWCGDGSWWMSWECWVSMANFLNLYRLYSMWHQTSSHHNQCQWISISTADHNHNRTTTTATTDRYAMQLLQLQKTGKNKKQKTREKRKERQLDRSLFWDEAFPSSKFGRQFLILKFSIKSIPSTFHSEKVGKLKTWRTVPAPLPVPGPRTL
jgi:hypothetical protein